jgi:kinesin family protein C2/C3
MKGSEISEGLICNTRENGNYQIHDNQNHKSNRYTTTTRHSSASSNLQNKSSSPSCETTTERSSTDGGSVSHHSTTLTTTTTTSVGLLRKPPKQQHPPISPTGSSSPSAQVNTRSSQKGGGVLRCPVPSGKIGNNNNSGTPATSTTSSPINNHNVIAMTTSSSTIPPPPSSSAVSRNTTSIPISSVSETKSIASQKSSNASSRIPRPPAASSQTIPTSNTTTTTATEEFHLSNNNIIPNPEMVVPISTKRTTTSTERPTVTSSAISNRPISNTAVPPMAMIQQNTTPYHAATEQEQALFEQRLCEDPYGVAVRKINANGKSSLRYVRCVVDEATSVHSFRNNTETSTTTLQKWKQRRGTIPEPDTNHTTRKSSTSSSSPNKKHPAAVAAAAAASDTTTMMIPRILVWGKKKAIAISEFTAVAKGKTSDRARKSTAPENRILTLWASQSVHHHHHLDIEAPTTLDRDKFARAFARFLNVPMVHSEEELERVIHQQQRPPPPLLWKPETSIPSSSSAPLPLGTKDNTTVLLGATSRTNLLTEDIGFFADDDHPDRNDDAEYNDNDESTSGAAPEDPIQSQAAKMENAGLFLPPLAPTTTTTSTSAAMAGGSSRNNNSETRGGSAAAQARDTSSRPESSTHRSSTFTNSSLQIKEKTAILSLVPHEHNDEEASHVSSLTGHGYDQELVEELHNALTELRAELEESRAEAARAVKVAEQAIQSAEKSNSIEWQNTVTHKAAEAAALAQRRSAEAMAKQRLAEERLEGERRSATFWRKQAELAEEEAGALQTRAAAAEVQRSAIEERLDAQWRSARDQILSLKAQFAATESSQREALEAAMERNRALELELESTRRDLQSKTANFSENNENSGEFSVKKNKKGMFGRKKKGGPVDGPDSTMLLSSNVASSSSAVGEPGYSDNANTLAQDSLPIEQILQIHDETRQLRKQFELLRRATADDLHSLPENARSWGELISEVLHRSQSEISRLHEKLAMESASRRKLLHEVQDLRGSIRVYCRPFTPASRPPSGLITLPSTDTLMLHRDKFRDDVGPLSFEFDRVFDQLEIQHDVYHEIEDICLGVLDGYNICVIAYGPSSCGKTRTILGDIEYKNGRIDIQNHGIQLRALKQLFTIAHHRNDRFKDTFMLTIVEVYNERICDLLASTQTGECRGKVIVSETKPSKRKSMKSTEDDASSSRPSKLEIRTDIHGETVVQGLVAVEVESFEDVCQTWEECLEARRKRIEEQGMDLKTYNSSCHVIATLKVTSANIATGSGTIGKIQFADLASADIIPRRPITDADQSSAGSIQNEWQFANRSLETFSECVEARLQFDRSVPYRNSTLTHLLRDSLEHDTKTLLIACISTDPNDIPETIATLKFASRLRRVNVGKATKHSVSTP